jgi:hypothetical protein
MTLTVVPAPVDWSASAILGAWAASGFDSITGADGKPTPGAAAVIGAAAAVDDRVDPVESGITAVSPMAAAVTAPTATVEASFCVQSVLAACWSLWARATK